MMYLIFLIGKRGVGWDTPEYKPKSEQPPITR